MKLFFYLLVSLSVLFSQACKKKKSNNAVPLTPEEVLLEKASADQNVDTIIIEQIIAHGITSSEELERACSDDNAVITSTTYDLHYPERQGCQFGESPNLEKLDQRIQAHAVNVNTLSLADKGLICDVTISTETDVEIHYDDYLFLTFGGYVVVGSNGDATRLLNQDSGLYVWDFEILKGVAVGNIGADPYCVGGIENCTVPPHDTPGPLSYAINTSEVGELGFNLAGWREVEINTVTTGDNDDTDCFHTAFDLSVTINHLQLD